MALSTTAIRAIAIRNSVARKTNKASNDNTISVTRSKPETNSLQQACIDAAGFAEHAGY